MSLNILVTGGAGYIGSHLSLSLINLGHKVTIVDNLSNGLKSNIEGLYKLTNNNFNFDEVDLLEEDKLKKGQNWDKFHLENIISWWKRKATKRYEKLKQENRFRDKVELWTEDNNIQIIR